MGLAMTPPCANGTGRARRTHAALGEGDAAEKRPASAPPSASVSGLKAALSAISDRRSAERAQHVAEALAAQGDVDEGAGERVAEPGAEPGRLGELLLAARVVSASMRTVRVGVVSSGMWVRW